MTQEMTHAWIFLAVPYWIRARLADVIAAADAINHAVPTKTELRVSLGWLRAHGLILKEGETYRLSETGLALRGACHHARATLMAWKAVAKRLATLDVVAAHEEELADRDLAAAYEAYRNRSRRRTRA